MPSIMPEDERTARAAAFARSIEDGKLTYEQVEKNLARWGQFASPSDVEDMLAKIRAA